jgi:diguanylate cyclase (GGDEF)-like protein
MVKPKILLVQNSQAQRNGSMRFLEGAGYEVVFAGSGISALALARRHAIDLILLDVALPDTEGSDLCRRFRSGEETSDVPIILLTARGFTPIPSADQASGPDDYLGKPYTEGELIARISAALQTKRLKQELEEKTRQLAESMSQADSLAIVDPETGLFNKKQFEAMLSKEFKRSLRFKQPLSCMLIDLDGEKMGRKAGEALLKAIIGLIQKTIREVDTAAWWTGEQLIVLLPNTLANDAIQAAARVLETVAVHPFTWPDATKVTMNIGVAGLPNKNIDTEAKLIAAADSASKRFQEFMLKPPNPVAMRKRIKS